MANLIKQLMQNTGKSADEVFDFIKKMSSGGRELDLGDIKSPSIKKGRPSKPIAINPNEIDVGKIKTDLELGDIPSSNMPLNELDLGPIDPLTLKRGRPSKPMIGVNEKDLGSVKSNLDIGDAQSSPVALNELDMPEISQVPSVSNQVPAISGGTSLAGGGRVPTVIGEAIDDVGGPLAKRSSTMPTEVGPQVLGKGRKYTDEAGNIVDAEIVEKTLDGIKKMPEGPLKKQALKKYAKWAAIAAGAGGLAMYNGDKQSTPNAISKLDAAIAKSSSPVSSKSNNYNDLIQEQSNNQPLTKSLESQPTKSLESQQQNKPISKVDQLLEDAESDTEAKDNRLNYMELMQNAQQSANQNQLSAALLKAGMQAGAAIAGPGAKADYSLADSLAASADKPIANVKGLIDTDISSLKLNQAREEMTDDAKMSDVNSTVSKIMSDAAVEAGFIKPGTQASAMVLQKMGMNLTSILNAKENARSRIATAKENALNRDTLAAVARENKLFDRETDREVAAKNLELKRTEKEEDLERKYKEQKLEKVAPLEASRLNLKRNINEYIALVKKVGTGELFGPDQKRMMDLQTQIATDQAKMADPTSSAMQGEVEKYRAGLPEIGTFVFESQNTALDILKRQLDDVDNRALAGYNARGIKPDPTLYKPVSANLTTKAVSPETQERLINHVMTQNKVDRAAAVNALTKAGKL
jgi:hypothetical protein